MDLIYYDSFRLQKTLNWKQRYPFQNHFWKLTGNHVFFHDRSGQLPNEYKSVTVDPLPKPISISFAEAIQTHIDSWLQTTSKPIVLSWSGGIDSTALAVAIMRSKHYDPQRLFFALTSRSIEEYPKFFQDHVRRHQHIPYSNNLLDQVDTILMTGDCGDQLVTSMITPEDDQTPWRDSVATLCQTKNVPSYVLSRLIEFGETADQEIRSAQQFWWWFDFCTKWQEVILTPYRWIPTEYTPEQYLERCWMPFRSPLMQSWARGWGSAYPKTESKRDFLTFIEEFTGDKGYSEHKRKWVSKAYLFRMNYKTVIYQDFSYEKDHLR